MEKGIDAVFYNFKYYILPDGVDPTAIEDGAQIKAKRLKEELCMAPDFIYESIAEETLTVENAKLLFPVKVNLYSHEEYDNILRGQVHKVCPGCTRYTDDGKPGLNGHHREISLGGVCYERVEKGENPPYACRIYWFYEELVGHLDELAKCIDKGDNKKLNKICKECAGWITAPELFVGGVKDGKYCIYMKSQGWGSGFTGLLFHYTAKNGKYEHNPFAKAGWLISPYIEAGVRKYRGKIKDSDKVASIKPSEDNPDEFEIEIYGKRKSDKDCDAAFNALYDYLTDKIGEAAFLHCVASVTIKEDKSELISAGELAEKIAAKYAELDKEGLPPSQELYWADSDVALPHMRSCSGVSMCGELTAISNNIERAKEFNFNGIASYAYVFVPADEDSVTDIMEVLSEYLAGEDKVPEPLIIKDDFAYSFALCGLFVCYGDDQKVNGAALDCFVGDEKAFFRFIKILAPVLTNLNARIVVVNDGGVTEYKAGYIIEPVDGETLN